MANDYSSSEAAGECSNECVDAVVSVSPLSGSRIGTPTYVQLSCDDPDAVIRYTTDGTEPDSLSAIYTGPFLVTASNTAIKAIAFTEDCTPSPVAFVGTFSNPSFPFVFSYACDTPDKGGHWGVFAPNGTADWHWQLQFTLAALTTIKRLEVYQLDADGNWTTGQVWSTGSPITTPMEAANPFACFPLLVFVAAVQQWVAYQSSLGAFGAGTYTWDLYGDQAFAAPSDNFFRLDIILSDDTRMSQIINATCTVTPPLCPAPATPTATGKCGGKSDVTFTGTVGRPYKIFGRPTACDPSVEFTPDWVEMNSGSIDVSPKTVEITGINAGCTYEFYVSIQAAGCDYKDSAIVTTVTPMLPSVSISSDKLIVDPGETFTLSWESSHLLTTVCNGCLAGELKTPFGCKPGNVAGSQLTSEAVCGIKTYEVNGCNPCGTAIATIQVEVRCAGTCGGSPPSSVQISNIGALDTTACAGNNYCAFNPKWDGKLFLDASPSCHYTRTGVLLMGSCFDSADCGGPCSAAIGLSQATISFSAGVWTLSISHVNGSGSTLTWVGRKLFGSNATGNYAKTGGCAIGPATLSVV